MTHTAYSKENPYLPGSPYSVSYTHLDVYKRQDPAIMASPLITTIVDAVSLVLYFAVAHRLLPL